jgi:U3 small nucleolar RNA-associated protein 7
MYSFVSLITSPLSTGHVKALKLQFLTKQFLLASINSFGQLHYQDVSTGEMIANYRTGLGRIEC